MKRILVSVKLQKYVAQQRPFDVLVFATKTPGIERDAFVAIFTADTPVIEGGIILQPSRV
ncbi:hypothetical protein D3C76_1368140 [compost metagenome]